MIYVQRMNLIRRMKIFPELLIRILLLSPFVLLLIVFIATQREREKFSKTVNILLVLQKGRYLTMSPMAKVLTPTENSIKQSDNTQTPPKLRLHNDCGST